MAEDSAIQWTTHTFNPWRGCTKVSPGCAHCYAETLSGRNPKTLGMWGPKGTRVVAAEAQWKLPLKWNREAARFSAGDAMYQHRPERPRVFCASLADVFEDWQGPMLNAAGDELFNDRAGDWSDRVGDKDGHRLKLTMHDVRRRLFAMIDATPLGKALLAGPLAPAEINDALGAVQANWDHVARGRPDLFRKNGEGKGCTWELTAAGKKEFAA